MSESNSEIQALQKQLEELQQQLAQLKAEKKKPTRKKKVEPTTEEPREPKPPKPPSQKEIKRQLSKIPTSQLTVEHYADRANPELSWAAAILKRGRSTARQRAAAAEIMSRVGSARSAPKLTTYWQNLSPEEKKEIAARGGKRRWEIWREEQAALRGQSAESEVENGEEGTEE